MLLHNPLIPFVTLPTPFHVQGSEVPYGFAAAKGWDAATGLGTPHFDKLLAAAMATVEDRQ